MVSTDSNLGVRLHKVLKNYHIFFFLEQKRTCRTPEAFRSKGSPGSVWREQRNYHATRIIPRSGLGWSIYPGARAVARNIASMRRVRGKLGPAGIFYIVSTAAGAYQWLKKSGVRIKLRGQKICFWSIFNRIAFGRRCHRRPGNSRIRRFFPSGRTRQVRDKSILMGR